ncbi:unnamed protein product [Calypogeia fissa]
MSNDDSKAVPRDRTGGRPGKRRMGGPAFNRGGRRDQARGGGIEERGEIKRGFLRGHRTATEIEEQSVAPSRLSF